MDNKIAKSRAEAFWRRFGREESQLRNAIERGATGEKVIIPILDSLKKILDQDIYLETSRHADGMCELILSADGVHANIEAVETLASSAPTMPHWRVIKFRPRRYPRYKSVNTEFGKVHVDDVQFITLEDPALSDKPKRLDLLLFVETLDNLSVRNRSWMLSLLLNLVVGEYDVMTRLGKVEHKTRKPLMADLNDKLRPLSVLPALIDAQRDVSN